MPHCAINSTRPGSALELSVAEVEGIVKAKPVESAAVQAGTVNIYGSTESPSAFPLLHYSNILVLIAHGRVTGIYSGTMVPGGTHGLQEMREWFVDLPVRNADQ